MMVGSTPLLYIMPLSYCKASLINGLSKKMTLNYNNSQSYRTVKMNSKDDELQNHTISVTI